MAEDKRWKFVYILIDAFVKILYVSHVAVRVGYFDDEVQFVNVYYWRYG